MSSGISFEQFEHRVVEMFTKAQEDAERLSSILNEFSLHVAKLTGDVEALSERIAALETPADQAKRSKFRAALRRGPHHG